MKKSVMTDDYRRILDEIGKYGATILRPIDEALIDAVKRGELDTVMRLIDDGADVEAKQWGGFYFFIYVKSSPMVEAVRSNNWEMIQLLRTYGASNVHL